MNKPDMINGKPSKALLYFTLPLILGNLFQQLYNIVDSIIVGNYVGGDALAAVGTPASITFLFVAIATGFSIGASVVIAQYFGARELIKMRTSIFTIIIATFFLKLLLCNGTECSDVDRPTMAAPLMCLTGPNAASRYVYLWVLSCQHAVQPYVNLPLLGQNYLEKEKEI